jgi:hypothetical protein
MVSGANRFSLRCRSRRRRTRPSIFLEADGRWYIGPGNGLFELIQRRARETRSWDIDWKPKHLSQLSRARPLRPGGSHAGAR